MSASLLERVLDAQQAEADRIGDAAQLQVWRERLAEHAAPAAH